MKTKFFRCSLMALATIAFLASCSQDEVLNTVPEQNEQTITVTASSLNFKASDAQTRISENGATTVFEANDQMGLYVVENYSDAENAKVILRNIPLTYQDGKWTADRNIYYYKNADYIAYFPYKADLAANIAPAEVETKIKETFDTYLTANKTDQSLKETYRNADLMLAKIGAADLAAQTEKTKQLNFVLKHQYSMIEVAIPTHKYYYQAGAGNQINFDVPMTDFILKVASSEINPYHLGEGVYRCLVTPGEINVEGSFTDPKDLRPVEFDNTSATTKSLTAGAYVRYNIGFTDAPDATRTERDIIGDYFCQDGTIFPSDFQDFPTNVIGIIYAKVGENDFTAEQAGKYSHYVLSIKERGNMGFKIKGNSQPAEATANIAGIPNYDSSNKENFIQCLTDMDGFNSTKTLNTLSYNITTDLANNWKGSFAPAEGVATSGWFIPSIGQWSKVQEILKEGEATYKYAASKLTYDNKEAVNIKMESLLGKLKSYRADVSETFNGCYWSLTQAEETGGNSKLYCLDISNTKFEIVLQDKTSQKRTLRPILAF